MCIRDRFPPRQGPIAACQSVLRATVKKTKELQDDGVFPTDKNSHDRARTRSRISHVCEAMTGEVPDAKQINTLLDQKMACYQCGRKGVTVYCKEGGGPAALLTKRCQESCSEKDLNFCSMKCCFKYRVQPVCGKCGNSDRKRMSYENTHFKDYHCKDCQVPCYMRDMSVWTETPPIPSLF